MVKFLYRGDYRIMAHYLDTHPEVDDAAAGTMLFGQWDKVAVQTDIHRQDTTLRWVNPDRALINSASGSMVHYLQEESHPVPLIQDILDSSPTVDSPNGLEGYSVTLPDPGPAAILADAEGSPLYDHIINSSMVLEAIQPYTIQPGEIRIVTWWRVAGPLSLPDEKLYPPPYGVYGGPRLRVFAHLIADGEFHTGDDGLWVDPYSLHMGDRLLQVHRFDLPLNNDIELELAIGLYDPWTGQRWLTADGTDQIVIELPSD